MHCFSVRLPIEGNSNFQLMFQIGRMELLKLNIWNFYFEVSLQWIRVGIYAHDEDFEFYIEN